MKKEFLPPLHRTQPVWRLPAALAARGSRTAHGMCRWMALACAVLLAPLLAQANPNAQGLSEPVTRDVHEFVLQRVGIDGMRVEVEFGRLDARLRLAPCNQVQAHLPPNTRLWGKTRIGLRCIDGPKAWNVILPLTVHVYAPALVAASGLPMGHTLQEGDLVVAEVNLSSERSPAVTAPPAALVGRVLNRALNAQQPVREAHLRSRQWFNAGEEVTIRAKGAGFAISGSGKAMTPGMEGQVARVRTDNGRVVTGVAVGERLVEITL